MYKKSIVCLFVSVLLNCFLSVSSAVAQVSGELKCWHKVTLQFEGPDTSETATPNPFTDYRLDVIFSNETSGATFLVPGYYAADGDAANTSASSGNQWRAHFSPCETGTWHYAVSFVTGINIHAADSAASGSSAGFMDGETGTFEVRSTDKTGRDFRGKGWLEYVGERYLRFKGTGEYFLKQGSDSPENFFEYKDFDGTPVSRDYNHHNDWQDGDPTWAGGKGKGMIGALNYLASEGMNSFSFIPMRINGDGNEETYPYINKYTYDRIDVSKLAQWEIVFEHATANGLFIHFKTQETENETLLDGGNTGVQRKLYYRELIARFGHHPALNWNLGEENGDWGDGNPPQSSAQRIAMAQYFWDNDPYRHLTVLHNGQGADDVIGNQSKLTGWSLQTSKEDYRNVHGAVLNYLRDAEQAGKVWAVACDEPGHHKFNIETENDGTSHREDARKNALWGTFMAGGWGNEWYFGYGYDHSDLSLTDFRSRDTWWDTCRYALEFFETYEIPLWEMENNDGLISSDGDYVMEKADEIYLVYLKNGGSGSTLDLSGATGDFEVRWYDPRNGGTIQNSTVTNVTAGSQVSLGSAPNNTSEDWVVLLSRNSTYNWPPTVSAGTSQTVYSPIDYAVLSGSASDDGTVVSFAWTQLSGPNTASLSATNTASITASNLVLGTYVFQLEATDDSGKAGRSSVEITVELPPFTDTDNDGVDDYWETNNGFVVGEDDQAKDEDKDGHSNYEEYMAGTNPFSSNSLFAMTIPSLPDSTNASFSLSWSSVTGRYYKVEFTTDLLDTNGWQLLHDFAAATPPQNVARVPMQLSNAYYRVLVTHLYDAMADIAYAINCGGGEYETADGIVYSADNYNSGGGTYTDGSVTDFAGTDDDELYKNERFGNNFSYNFNVENGDYEVLLHMTENYHASSGLRVFSVSIEGAEVIANLDLMAVAGRGVAYEQTYSVTVDDGELNVSFSTTTDNAKVNAIRVTKTNP